MNTFVPFPDIHKSAKFLDNKRLNKQIAEAAQILRQLEQYPHGGWRHHPAVKMWVGYDEALFLYMKACNDEWVSRGFRHHAEMSNFPEYDNLTSAVFPSWWGRADVHESHHANLLRKFQGLQHEPYVWPLPDSSDITRTES